MVPFVKPLIGQGMYRDKSAFTTIEILVVVGILAILSGIAIASGSRSLERSKIDAVAIELAGWLTAIHAKDSSGCYIDYSAATNKPDPSVSTARLDPPNEFSSNDTILVLRNPPACSASSSTFRLPSNAGGDYKLSLYSPIIFGLRGTAAIANNVNCASADVADGVCDGSDIKIYHPNSETNSGLLRCIRINYWTATVEIGSKNNAMSIAEKCASFDRF